MLAALRARAGTVVAGIPFGVTLCGAVNFLLEFPEPLPAFMETANASEGVQQLIGTPISHGVFWNGKATRSQAQVAIPVSGPHGHATLHGRAIRQRAPPGEDAPPWQIITLDVVCENSGTVVDLLEESGASAPSPAAQSPAMERMAAAMAAMHAPNGPSAAANNADTGTK